MRLHRGDERLRDRQLECEGWFTFHPKHRGEHVDGFGELQMLNEYRVSPDARVPSRLIEGASLVTYVVSGMLSCRDSLGRQSNCRAGEFSYTAGLRNIHYSESNGSSEIAHIFQLYLVHVAGKSVSNREQKRFSVANRRGRWCAVAARDGRDGALVINSNAVVYSAILEVGQHVVFEMPAANRAWLHVVRGKAMLDSTTALATGDGVGVDAGRSLALTANAVTECLLIVTE